MERWRLMEEFENIAKNQPVFPGKTISHQGANALVDGELVKRDEHGNFALTSKGSTIWVLWRRVHAGKV